MYSIIITLILVNIYIKTPNGKLILLPFLVCSIALLLKNIFLLINKDKYSKLFNKIYAIGFLMFWFGFLIVWCYTSVINKQYSTLKDLFENYIVYGNTLMEQIDDIKLYDEKLGLN